VGGGVVSYWRRGDQQPETIRGAELTCGTSPGLEHGGVVAMGGLSLASSRRRSTGVVEVAYRRKIGLARWRTRGQAPLPSPLL
jgi:hypothetical protein